MLTDNEIIIAVARLDGWFQEPQEPEWLTKIHSECHRSHRRVVELFDYLTSRDAIVPVIEKQPFYIQYHVVCILKNGILQTPKAEVDFMFVSARDLSIALLKAVGEWRE